MRKPVVLTVILAVALAVAAVPTAQAASTPEPLKVSIGDNFFKPKKKTIARKTKVTWTWKGEADHNVRLADAPDGITRSKYNSETQSEGTFSRRLKTAGKYTFVCTIHSGMEQTIKVSSSK
jgi:plastocyanin